MVDIKKTSSVLGRGHLREIKKTSHSQSQSTSSSAETSPFAANPVDSLRSLTDRKSRPLTEDQWLILLQKAFQPFATEARGRLPSNIKRVEQKIRKKMLEEGFSEVVATEAGDEAVTVILEKRSAKKS